MNILYFSLLRGALYSGPNYSVPKQIAAQSKIDNVFWYNYTNNDKNNYKSETYYHDISDFPSGKISEFPSPFNRPDIIVIEEVYVYHNPLVLYEIKKVKIPYVIVPRSQLTQQALERKSFKKRLANMLVYKRFVSNAAAIQFLTKQEMLDSVHWNNNAVIIPNGIDKSEFVKSHFNNGIIKGILIGRLEPYQKGLDLLIESISMIRKELLEVHFSLDVVGPVKDSVAVESLETKIIQQGLSDIVHIIKEPLYGKEKTEKLLDSDLFIMTSRFEGLPMGLLEALSLGLPCLVTQGTNMRAEIDLFDAGWTADNDVHSISNAVLQLITERNLLLQKGKNAIELSKKYNWDEIAIKSHDEYMKILS